MPLTFVEPAALAERIRTGDPPLLLDIRSRQQFQSWHLPGSTPLPVDALPDRLAELPQDRDIVVICNRGNTSRVVCEVLQRAGFTAAVLAGGLKRWNTLYDAVPVSALAPSGFRAFQVRHLGKGCLSYVVASADARAVVVDPGRHPTPYQQLLQREGLTPVAVLDTHVHADHISGGPSLAAALNVPYLLPKMSQADLPFTPLEGTVATLFGDAVEVIATPGHTPESVCLVFGRDFLCTGDTLFLETVGRSDLGQAAEENARQLYRSVIERLWPLDGNLIVLPAHTAEPLLPAVPPCAAPLATVRTRNNLSRFTDAVAFARYVSEQIAPTPPNFETIKNLNSSGGVADDGDELELGANRCAVSR